MESLFSGRDSFSFHYMSAILKSLFRKKRPKESRIKYWMYLLHLWTGLLSAIVVLVLCISGCLYAFKNQITELYNYDKVFVKRSGEAIGLEELENQLSREGLSLNSVYLPKEDNRAWSLSYKNENGTISASNYDPYQRMFLGSTDQGLERFFSVVLDLHRTLLLGNVGRQILGIGCLIFLSLMLSGLVIWIPRKLKYLRQSLSIKWKGKFKRVNYDFHKVIGFYTILPLAFITLTGLYVTYPWVKNGLLMSMGAESIEKVGTEASTEGGDQFASLMQDMLKRQGEKTTLQEKPQARLHSIVKSTQNLFASKASLTIEFPNEENPRFMVRRTHNEHPFYFTVQDDLSFDRTGVLQNQSLFSSLPLDKQFAALVKPLHTGEIMGLPSIILYFILTLFGALIPISGIIIWWNRVRKLK